MLTRTLHLHITEIGAQLKYNLETKLRRQVGNRCIEEGYISPNDIDVVQYSAGRVFGEQVAYHVVFQCWAAHPVEGMVIECLVKTITKAGIHAENRDKHGNVPITIFVARDHNYTQQAFMDCKEGDRIHAKVMGIRFELNDPCVYVIADMYQDGIMDEPKAATPAVAKPVKIIRGKRPALPKPQAKTNQPNPKDVMNELYPSEV